LLVGWLTARAADVAARALDAGATGAEAHFYAGKIAVGAFFAAERLPIVTAEYEILRRATLSVMSVADAAF